MALGGKTQNIQCPYTKKAGATALNDSLMLLL